MKNILLFIAVVFAAVSPVRAQGVDLKGGLQHKSLYVLPGQAGDAQAAQPVDTRTPELESVPAPESAPVSAQRKNPYVPTTEAAEAGVPAGDKTKAGLEKSLRRIWDKYTAMRDVSDVKSSALQVINAQTSQGGETSAPLEPAVEKKADTPDTGLSGVMQEYNTYKQQRGKMRTLERSMPTDGMRK